MLQIATTVSNSMAPSPGPTAATEPPINCSALQFLQQVPCPKGLAFNLSGAGSSTDPYDLDPGRSPMSRVCFSLSLLLLAAHNILATGTPDLRALYGPYLLLALYAHMAVYFVLLVACLMPPTSLACVIAGVATHYAILTAAGWLLVTTFHLWHDIYLVGRGLWVVEVYEARQYAKNAACALLIPVLPVGGGLVFHTTLPEHHMSPRYGTITCSFASHFGFLYLLFIPLFLSLTVQTSLLLSTVKMHHSNIHERQSLARSKHHQARFTMVAKITITNWLVWFAALLFANLSYSILWHLFSLFNALQVIFLIITFVFTRPVMEVFLKIVDSAKKPEDPTNNGSATLPMLPTMGTRTSFVEGSAIT